MRGDNESDRTITDYLRVIAYLDTWLASTGRSRFVADVTKDDLEGFKSYWLEAKHEDGRRISRTPPGSTRRCSSRSSVG